MKGFFAPLLLAAPTLFFAGLAAAALAALLVAAAARAAARRRDAIVSAALSARTSAAPSRARTIALRLLVVVVALALGAALARPRWGERTETVERRGADVVLVLDTSASMRATDVTPSRFVVARQAALSLLSRTSRRPHRPRRLRGRGAVLVPLTLDAAAVGLFLEALEPGIGARPGTSLASGLAPRPSCFPRGQRAGNKCVVFSDGEDLEGGVEKAAERAKAEGIVVHTVFVGGDGKGAPVPETDVSGQVTGYKTDASGAPVLSKPDPGLLRDLAAETGGTLLRRRARPDRPLRRSHSEIDLSARRPLSADARDEPRGTFSDSARHRRRGARSPPGRPVRGRGAGRWPALWRSPPSPYAAPPGPRSRRPPRHRPLRSRVSSVSSARREARRSSGRRRWRRSAGTTRPPTSAARRSSPRRTRSARTTSGRRFPARGRLARRSPPSRRRGRARGAPWPPTPRTTPGMTLFRAGDYEKAAGAFREALKRQPGVAGRVVQLRALRPEGRGREEKAAGAESAAEAEPPGERTHADALPAGEQRRRAEETARPRVRVEGEDESREGRTAPGGDPAGRPFGAAPEDRRAEAEAPRREGLVTRSGRGALLLAALAGATLSLPFSARAGELQVEVFADQPKPAADDLVRLTYRLSGDGLSGDIKPPSPLPLRNLALAGGPSRSDQVSFVNGVFSRSLSLTYYLRPKGPGSAEVGETVWTVGEKTLKAAPFLFEVGPARGRTAGVAPRRGVRGPAGRPVRQPRLFAPRARTRAGRRRRAPPREAPRRPGRHPRQDDGLRRRGDHAPRGARHLGGRPGARVAGAAEVSRRLGGGSRATRPPDRPDETSSATGRSCASRS